MTSALGTMLTAREVIFTIVILPILLLWILVNGYIYYPVVRVLIGRRLRRGWQWLHVLVAPLTGTRPTPDGSDDRLEVRSACVDPLADDYLPTLAVLLPAYQESTVIEQSVRSTVESDYPAEKLELYVLTEPDDEETVEAVQTLSEDYGFAHLTVPSGYPDDPCKPRALNYGFEFSDEAIVCVIDAEDIVDPEFFRQAASEIVVGDLDYVQARLDMVNEDDGWLNTMFRADYGYWFRAILPSFAKVGYPMPLGGTSNVFRRLTLEEMHDRRLLEYGSRWDDEDWEWVWERGLEGLRPWDPRNVTEDFELGLFLWKEGKDFAYIDAVTREESPLTLDGWIRQRTRWKKGKLYTYLQYRETPPEGPHAKFHLFMQSMLPHTGPLNIVGIIVTLMLANIAGFGPGELIMGGEFVGLAFVLFAMALHSREYWNVSGTGYRTRIQRAIKVAATLPFYWVLQWAADLRAIYQTYAGDIDSWELTTHFGRNRVEGDVQVFDEPETVPELLNGEDDMMSGPGLRAVPFDSVDDHSRFRELLSTAGAIPVLAVVTLVALAIRAYHLTTTSLSATELYWLDRASGSLHSLVVGAGDLQPPLHALLLRGWITLFGTGDVTVRSLSVVLSVAAVLALFMLAVTLYGKFTGLIGTGLFGIATTQVHVGRTVGPHALAVLLAICSHYFFAQLDRRSIRTELGYVLTTVALLYTHVFGFAVLLGQWIYSGLSERESIAGTPEIRLLLGISTVLGFPWLAGIAVSMLSGPALTDTLAYGWLPDLTLRGVRSTILSLAGHPAVYPVTAANVITWVVAGAISIIFSVTAVFAVLTVRADDRVNYMLVDKAQAASLTSFLIASLALPFGASVVGPSLFVPRFTVLATIPLFLLVARGITNLRARRLQSALLVSILLGSAVIGAFYVDSGSEEEWRLATRQIQGGADPGDLVVFQPGFASAAWDHYAPASELATATVPEKAGINDTDRRRLRRQLRTHDDVWLLRYRQPSFGPGLRTLRNASGSVSSNDFGELTVYRFESAPDRNETRTAVTPKTAPQTG